MGLNIDGGVQSDYLECELRYHESWDWLIPVVQKLIASNNCFEKSPKRSLAIASKSRFSETGRKSSFKRGLAHVLPAKTEP